MKTVKKMVSLTLLKEDADWLETKKNTVEGMSAYIRQLIMADRITKEK